MSVRTSCTASTAMAPVCSLAGKCKRADRKHRLVEPDEVNNSRGATFGACKLTKEAPPNLSADYLYPRQTAVVKQATETARNSVPSGGHSSSYLCQQDSVFAARDRFPVREALRTRLRAFSWFPSPPSSLSSGGLLTVAREFQHTGSWQCTMIEARET